MVGPHCVEKLLTRLRGGGELGFDSGEGACVVICYVIEQRYPWSNLDGGVLFQASCIFGLVATPLCGHG
jgi:hypothetical protein